MFKESKLDVLKNTIDLVKYMTCTYLFYKSLTYIDMDVDVVQSIINTLIGFTSFVILLIPIMYKISKSKRLEAIEVDDKEIDGLEECQE